MRLIVGLGNPGRRYVATRHNVGFRIVERFGEKHGVALDAERFEGRFGRGRALGLDVGLLEPLTYMNLSGRAVAGAVRMLPVGELSEDLLIVVDDTDLPFGRLRIRARGSAGGHKGLTDIIACLGSREFPRLRFGVGRPPPGVDTADHVLRPFAPDEAAALPARIDEAVAALEAILAGGIEAAMSRFNRAPEEAG